MMTDTPGSTQRLHLLYRLTQTFNSSLDLNEVLNRVMDEVVQAVEAERGFVMLSEDEGNLVFKTARGIDRKTIDDPQFQVSRSIVERVAREGQPVLTSDAQSDERFSMRQSIRLLGLRSILCVPLNLKDKILGVIYVDNRLQTGIFSRSDLDLVSAIASNAAIAIENARLYQLAVERGRLERELQMARQVQASLLPTEVPEFEGWEFIATWQPASQVAGDYYDFIPLQDGNLGLVIGDVTDKGMPAALFMALTRTFIRAYLSYANSPLQAILNANNQICMDSSDGMFVTLFYAQLDPKSGELIYVNAGHNPPILIRSGDDGSAQLTHLTRTGMALGVECETSYGQKQIFMKPGDSLLIYTDGLTDTINEEGEAFGLERIERVMISQREQSAGEIVSSILLNIQEFSVASDPFDDITLMMIKRL